MNTHRSTVKLTAVAMLAALAAGAFFPHSSSAQNLAPGLADIKTYLESELEKLDAEIAGYDTQLKEVSGKRKTLENEVFIVTTKIKRKEVEVKATELELKRLEKSIAATEASIGQTKKNIERSGVIMSETLKSFYQQQQRDFLEVFLANVYVSNFISQGVYLNRLQQSLASKISDLKDLKVKLEDDQRVLEAQEDETNALLVKQKLQKTDLEDLKREKNNLLATTKGKESEYQKLIAASQRRAAEIKAQIYRLAGGVGDITFGEALQYANFAGGATSVRPSFLLAILDYESKIGKNTGRCTYTAAMKPSERPTFLKITGELGLDPDKTLVSCKPWYGWGGAMGPAQFLPSTWASYRNRVAQATGHNPPSPWNIIDAFTAAGIKLADAGAIAKTYNAEWKAAMIYFAGGNWSNSRLRFYGDNVMSLATKYEADIKALGLVPSDDQYGILPDLFLLLATQQ